MKHGMSENVVGSIDSDVSRAFKIVFGRPATKKEIEEINRAKVRLKLNEQTVMIYLVGLRDKENMASMAGQLKVGVGQTLSKSIQATHEDLWGKIQKGAMYVSLAVLGLFAVTWFFFFLNSGQKTDEVEMFRSCFGGQGKIETRQGEVFCVPQKQDGAIISWRIQ